MDVPHYRDRDRRLFRQFTRISFQVDPQPPQARRVADVNSCCGAFAINSNPHHVDEGVYNIPPDYELTTNAPVMRACLACGAICEHSYKCESCVETLCNMPHCFKGIMLPGAFCSEHRTPCRVPDCTAPAICTRNHMSPSAFRCQAHRNVKGIGLVSYKPRKKGTSHDPKSYNHRRRDKSQASKKRAIQRQIHNIMRNHLKGCTPKVNNRLVQLRFGCTAPVLISHLMAQVNQHGFAPDALGFKWHVVPDVDLKLYDLTDDDVVGEAYNYHQLVVKPKQ